MTLSKYVYSWGNIMKNKIQTQIQNLRQFEKERKMWMALSAAVLITIVGIIFDWPSLSQNNIAWFVGGGGLLLTVVWWYWTMQITKELLTIRIQDRAILQDIIEDVKHIRTEILRTLPNRD